ncbi:MAG: hypothetical protein GF417_05550 [Candidatus Latescibacteria bacterium]|nr:hypothetical protein [bacterium]MBD3423880.1 hypothetical protein [Candidatus Latescibacterota bacterium]
MDFPRGYATTHPWISFELNMKKAHPRVWILIGKAMHGCRLLRESAADPSLAAEIRSMRRAEAVRGSARMEAVSLSDEQLHEILEMGQEDLDRLAMEIQQSGQYEGGSEGEKILVFNIIRLFLFLSGELSRIRENPDIRTEAITGINEILHRGVDTGEARPGSFRTGEIEVDGYAGVNPAECSQLVDRLTRGIAESRESFPAGDEIASGLIRAIIAHRYLTWILPFDTGNALTARFVELQVMLSAGVPQEAALFMNSYYSLTQGEYRELLYGDRKGSVFDFMEYCLRGFVKGLEQIAARVEKSRLPAVWNSCLDRLMGDERDEIAERRKVLVLGIRGHAKGVTPRQVRYASPEVTKCYAERSDKTLTRDISSLVELGVLERARRRILVNSSLVFPFGSSIKR